MTFKKKSLFFGEKENKKIPQRNFNFAKCGVETRKEGLITSIRTR
jgi:hypothetical protein